MKQTYWSFSELDEEKQGVLIFVALLPPPVSLDILCTVTGHRPVKILQIVEDLVRGRILSRYTEKGAGYYYMPDSGTVGEFLETIPRQILAEAAQNAISGVCEYLPDSEKRWLHLAHIYQVSGIPVSHFQDLIKAGNYCLDLNLPTDAACYYHMALEGMNTADLDQEEQRYFIDATIGLCTCRDNSLSPKIRRRYLKRSLEFCTLASDPVRMVKLRVLIARTFIKTARSDEACKHLESAWQMLAEHDLPAEIRLQVALANSELFFWQGLIDKAIEQYESVIGNHEELPSDVEMLKSCIKLGHTYGVAGETARGAGLIKSVRRKAKELNAQDLDRYATLILVIVLADAGRIDEAETYLKEVFNTQEKFLDNYILWPGNGKRAYFAYCRGDYEMAFTYLGQAYESSLALETPHHQGPDNLEVMLGLEDRGMVHPQWNFDSDIARLLKWPDIYMQGVAFRYLALKAFKKKGPVERIKADLNKSISLLTRAGAKIELSHAQVLMSRILISEKEMQAAEKMLKAAWDIFSKVNPNLFPKDLKPYLDSTSKNALWVESLLGVGEALGSIRTRNQLLGQIIRQAMRIAGAERGAIFLRQNKELDIAASRNISTPEISSQSFRPQMEIIEEVFASGTEVAGKITFDQAGLDEEADLPGWAGCFPIRLKARVMGVIFMDCRLTRLELQEDEISLLRIISNQAAVALANLEAYEEIIDLNTHLEAEARFYRNSFEAEPVKTQMIGQTEAFRQMLQLVQRVAKSDTTVMITGETGVGKDLVAQAIHQYSERSSGPFIAVNVVSLSQELIASELFGHEKGAFTGASQTKRGRFELASEGTLFLDDIDAFSPDIQAKMLRVLETKEFERVGGTQTLKTRFRLVAASNRNIEELVAQGLFRSDFYYRMNVFPIRIPSLRERKEDIPLLAMHFMEMFSRKFKKKFDKISKKDLDRLVNYSWPGNVRELRHIIERSVLLSNGGRLFIPPLDTAPSMPAEAQEESILPLKEMEARHIVKALSRCHGKVSGVGGAAEILGIKPTTLYSMMKRLGVEREAYQLKNSSK